MFISDLLVTILSFFIAYEVRASGWFAGHLDPLFPLGQYVILLVFIVPIWAFLLYSFKSYFPYSPPSAWAELWKVFQVVFLGGLILGTIVFAFKFQYISRLFAMFFAITNFLLLSLERFLFRTIRVVVKKQGVSFRTVLIVGSGEKATEFGQQIEGHRHWGLELVGYVKEDEAPNGEEEKGLKIIGKVRDLPEIIEREVVDEIVFVLPPKKLQEMEKFFYLCELEGVRVRVVTDFFPYQISKLSLESFHGTPLLTFSPTPTNILLLYAKRLFDIFFSLVVIILTSPVLLFTAILIKLTSEGPVFFKQVRSGLQGRQFTLYKFRSMVVDAEMRKEELAELNEMDGPTFKIRNDPRVTPLGRFIRKFSIDELPQFLNVLKGDMSIVGPRPPIPEEVEHYERWQRRRLSMKPGLTCFWQISGRNIVDFNRWMQMDLNYIDNWSLWLDFKILFKTIPMVLWGKGAS